MQVLVAQISHVNGVGRASNVVLNSTKKGVAEEDAPDEIVAQTGASGASSSLAASKEVVLSSSSVAGKLAGAGGVHFPVVYALLSPRAQWIRLGLLERLFDATIATFIS